MSGSGENGKRGKLLQTYSALIIGFVCVVIGVPLWWETTDVYRVSLPYSTIEELEKHEPTILVKCEVVLLESAATERWFKDKLDAELNIYLNSMAETASLVRTKYDVSVRMPNEAEIHLFSDNVQNIIDLESKLSSIHDNKLSNGQYRFFVSPSSFADLHLKSEQDSILGLTRNVFIRPSTVEGTAATIGKVLKNVLLREQDLSEAYLATKKAERMKPSKDEMRSLKSSLGYHLTFTLMNPQPDMVSVQWNMQDAVEEYLTPITDVLSEYADISVRSQYVHLTGINAQAKYNSVCECYVLPSTKLPHIINPIEPYLASHITNNPTLNFVVYIPTRGQTPLKIFDQTGSPTKTNSFLVPRWGGLLIYNVETPEAKNNSSVEIPFVTQIDHKKMFSVFLAQLKSLMGFRKLSDGAVKVVRSGSKVIADWELDAWLFERCVENIGKSSSTLYSLSQLLNQISNIVINDDVADSVSTAVVSSQASLELLSNAQIRSAFLHSRNALNSSEKAFFDPSLLELLYFPEDQKFAIYIPLFLPIGIPVVNSIFQAIRYLKTKHVKTE